MIRFNKKWYDINMLYSIYFDNHFNHLFIFSWIWASINVFYCILYNFTKILVLYNLLSTFLSYAAAAPANDVAAIPRRWRRHCFSSTDQTWRRPPIRDCDVASCRRRSKKSPATNRNGMSGNRRRLFSRICRLTRATRLGRTTLPMLAL